MSDGRKKGRDVCPSNLLDASPATTRICREGRWKMSIIDQAKDELRRANFGEEDSAVMIGISVFKERQTCL